MLRLAAAEGTRDARGNLGATNIAVALRWKRLNQDFSATATPIFTEIGAPQTLGKSAVEQLRRHPT